MGPLVLRTAFETILEGLRAQRIEVDRLRPDEVREPPAVSPVPGRRNRMSIVAQASCL
jgi:hypothetical protein